MLRQPSLSVLPVVALSPSNEAYHWEGPGHIQNVLTPTLLITHWLPMSSFDKNQIRKKAKKMTMMTETTTATRSEHGKPTHYIL
jgi:hypothetical protein